MHELKHSEFMYGTTVSAVLFALLIAANWPLFSADYSPLGDHALDILLTQTAEHRLLLTGHYSVSGIYHPGPFFFYIRLFGEWLVGGHTATVFAAQVVGIIACNAGFAGLFAVLVRRLAVLEGAGRLTADCLPLVALMVVVIQFSHKGGLADPWMPYVVILPVLTALVAAALMLRGVVIGFVAGTFAAAAVVHGYIPAAATVVPVWLGALAIGWRVRRVATGRGFPTAAWGAVLAIIAAFLAPLLIDMAINPPGNAVRIILQGVVERPQTPLPTLRQLVNVYLINIKHLHGWLWLAVPPAIGVCLVSGRHRTLLRDGILIGTIAGCASLLFFSRSPTPLYPYTGTYLIGLSLLPIMFGVLVIGLELARRHAAAPVMMTGMTLVLLLSTSSLVTPFRSFPGLRDISRFVVADAAGAKNIALMLEKPSRPIGSTMLGAIMLDLDRLGVHPCILNPFFAVMFPPERVCNNAPQPPERVYRLAWLPMDACTKDEGMSPASDGNFISVPFNSDCLRLRSTTGE